MSTRYKLATFSVIRIGKRLLKALRLTNKYQLNSGSMLKGTDQLKERYKSFTVVKSFLGYNFPRGRKAAFYASNALK